MDNDKRNLFTYFEGLLRFFLGSGYLSGCLALLAVALIGYVTVSQILAGYGISMAEVIIFSGIAIAALVSTLIMFRTVQEV